MLFNKFSKPDNLRSHRYYLSLKVTVRFEVVPGNATNSVDYFYTSNNVILSDQEASKQVRRDYESFINPLLITENFYFTARKQSYVLVKLAWELDTHQLPLNV